MKNLHGIKWRFMVYWMLGHVHLMRWVGFNKMPNKSLIYYGKRST